MVPTFNHPWVHTSDIFDLTFCFFMFLYLIEGKFLPALLVALLTAINRETGAFAAVFYVCLAFSKHRPQVIVLRAVILALVPYAAAVLVRKIVLGDQLPLESTGQWYTGLTYNFDLLVEALKRPSPIGWPSLLFAMMLLPWITFLRRSTNLEFKIRVAFGFFFIFAITAAVGINAEVRTFIPCIGLLLACSVAAPESSEAHDGPDWDQTSRKRSHRKVLDSRKQKRDWENSSRPSEL
jgi:hypothetical protein